MRRLLILISLVLVAAPVAAEEYLCFDLPSAQRLDAELVRLELLEKSYEYCEEGIEFLGKEIEQLDKIQKDLEDQVDLCTGGIEDMQRLSDIQHENCEIAIDAVTPGFWQKLKWGITGGGAGAILALLLLL
jgi:hypothetical protein